MPPQTQNSTGYDPLNPTPYTPPQMPEPQPVPAAQPVQQEPLQSGPKVPTTGFGRAAGAAYLVSSLLKGIAQGRSQAEVRKVALAKRAIDGLQWNYNNAAEKLWSMKDSDPKSQEYQDALNGVNVAWGKLQLAYQNYFDMGQKKPKQGKDKKKAQPAAGGMSGSTPSPTGTGQMDLSWLTSQDQGEKVQGALQMGQKLGPPVLWQMKQYNSPDALKARELARQQQATQSSANEVQQQTLLHQKSVGDVQAQIDKIAQTPPAQQTPEMKKQLETLQATKNVLTGGTDEVAAKKAVVDAAVEEVTKANGGKPPTPDQYDRILVATGMLHAAPVEGNLIPFFSDDPKDPTKHTFVGSMDQKTGAFVPAPPELAGKSLTKGNPPASGSGAGNGKMTATPIYAPDKTLLGRWYASANGTQTWVPAPGQSATPPAKGYGSAGAAEEIDVLKKASALRLAANEAKKFVNNPTPTNAQSLIFAYVKGNIAGAGRLTQAEILQAARAGSYGTRLKNWAETATTGHPDAKFMKEMADTIETEAKEAEKLANQGRGGSSGSGDGTTPPTTPPAAGDTQNPPQDANAFIKKHGG